MTTKLQRAINIATTPTDNARLILNDERAQRERRICHENSEGERIYSDVLSAADYAVFNAVACRCRSEFERVYEKLEEIYHEAQIEIDSLSELYDKVDTDTTIQDIDREPRKRTFSQNSHFQYGVQSAVQRVYKFIQ